MCEKVAHNFLTSDWGHDLQDLVRRLEEQLHHVDETVKGGFDWQMLMVLMRMMMVIMMIMTMIIEKPSKARLTDGCWSPTKISLFFTTRTDGFVEVGHKFVFK